MSNSVVVVIVVVLTSIVKTYHFGLRRLFVFTLSREGLTNQKRLVNSLHNMNPNTTRIKNRITSQVHLFNVENDANGKLLINQLRSRIKESKTHRRIVIYGRGHRFGKGRTHKCKCGNNAPSGPSSCGCGWYDNRYQSSIPRELASHLAVYVMG